MSEMAREWLRSLYAGALDETKAAVVSERLWQNGATSDDEIQDREQNIRDLEEYIEVLQERLDALR